MRSTRSGRGSCGGLGGDRRPIAVIADLQGPKVRIGELPEPVTLERGDEVVVAAEEAASDGELR